MSWFDKRRQQKATAATRALLKAVDGRELAYVTRREPDENGNPGETVLGKGGRLWLHEDEVRVSGPKSELLSCPIPAVEAGELMSGDGMVLQGHNTLTDRDEMVVAYYLYFR